MRSTLICHSRTKWAVTGSALELCLGVGYKTTLGKPSLPSLSTLSFPSHFSPKTTTLLLRKLFLPGFGRQRKGPLSLQTHKYFMCAYNSLQISKNLGFGNQSQKVLFAFMFHPSISFLCDNNHLIFNFSFSKVKELENLAII